VLALRHEEPIRFCAVGIALAVDANLVFSGPLARVQRLTVIAAACAVAGDLRVAQGLYSPVGKVCVGRFVHQLSQDSPSNGEAERPHAGVRSEPRAHTLFPRPRRHYRASRPAPAMVRSHPHRSPLCACGTAPATEANLPPGLSAPQGRTRTPVAPNEDACKTTESATVRIPQSQSKHPPSSSRRLSPRSGF